MHYRWAGEIIVCPMGLDLFGYVDMHWIGPFRTLAALELAASAEL